jgi:hypothetical protein
MQLDIANMCRSGQPDASNTKNEVDGDDLEQVGHKGPFHFTYNSAKVETLSVQVTRYEETV